MTSQAENYKHLRGVLIEYMSEKMFESNVFRIQKVILFEKEYSVLVNQDCLTLPVTSQPPFPAL